MLFKMQKTNAQVFSTLYVNTLQESKLGYMISWMVRTFIHIVINI